MNFELDTETAQMCDAVADFARHKLAASGDSADAGDFRQRWRLAAQQGLAGAAVPAEFGGGGADAVVTAALMEALGYGCPDTGLAFSLAAHGFACLMPIVAFGTTAQKQRWLPGLCGGELIAAHAITEPDAGSDALRLSTRAVRDHGRFVLNGDKCFTTNAPIADVFIVQAVTDPGAGYFGLSSFIVPAGTPGLTVGPPYRKVGLRGSPTADVRLEDCAVPADHLLGPEGAGASVFSSSMAWERTCLFAIYLGAMKRVVDSTAEYARNRRQFGEPIASFQAVSHRIVDMRLRWESARLLLFRAASLLAQGRDDELATAMAKLAVSEAAVATGLDAIQLRGALGVLDGEAETFLRDALPSRIFSGTSEIQKNNIARALGLTSGRGRRARAGGDT
ncbi:MAG TPA: acyl-CoA dehydrogenase family protein [Streptosporangiaceae bacterium]|jgi:alkylation response protein AidB-like acyl-CoA dehydrogenase